jgi:hypothetical protein
MFFCVCGDVSVPGGFDMPSRLKKIISALLALLAITGCTKPLLKNKSPLAPARMSSDSCVLDIFFVRVPFGDPKVNDKLWQELDEQHFPADLRTRLIRNGFRVGVVEGQIPIALSNLLELTDKPPPTNEAPNANLSDLAAKPKVVRQHMQIRSGQPSGIIASGIYDQLPVLLCESDRLSGETYNQAQGIFNVKTFPLPDGCVRIDMAPEVQYGQARQHWVADQGMMLLDSGKPKRSFDELAVSAVLSPGGMLVMTSLPNRSGSLGHHFFTENNGLKEQKLLVVRLSQTQHDGLFDAAAEQPTE